MKKENYYNKYIKASEKAELDYKKRSLMLDKKTEFSELIHGLIIVLCLLIIGITVGLCYLIF